MSGTYTTVQGDMWDQIAQDALGDETLAGDLMRANRKYLGFYTMPAGLVLTLPDVAERKPEGLPPWKR